MLLLLLLIIPIIGIFIISTSMYDELSAIHVKRIKFIALTTSIFNLFISLIIFILFDFSNNQFQFVQEYYEISSFDFYLGIDGLSIYFVLLTTIIMPIFLLLSILTMSSIMGTTDFDALYKTNFNYLTQLFLFYGIFISFAVKTPTIFLNT